MWSWQTIIPVSWGGRLFMRRKGSGHLTEEEFSFSSCRENKKVIIRVRDRTCRKFRSLAPPPFPDITRTGSLLIGLRRFFLPFSFFFIFPRPWARSPTTRTTSDPSRTAVPFPAKTHNFANNHLSLTRVPEVWPVWD